MEEIREVRKAVGDEFVLAHDPVQQYNRHEAMVVGRLLDELNYLWFEDPIRSSDTEGLVELAAALDTQIHVG
jgi:L-alanine-DL-glutamate epimerase-like enolase superfamily enzyme